MKKIFLVLFLGLFGVNAHAFDLNKAVNDVNSTAQNIEASKAEAKVKLEAKISEAEAKKKAMREKAEEKKQHREKKVKEAKDSLDNLKNAFVK